MNIFVRSLIDAIFLGALVTLFTVLFNGTQVIYLGGHWASSYGYPLTYYSVWRSYATFTDINFLNLFLDFAFWFVTVFSIVTFLSLAFRQLAIRKKGQISLPEIKHEQKHSLLFIAMNEHDIPKVFRLLFVHNLAMTFLLVLGIIMYIPGYFWMSPLTIFTNPLGIVSWIYWVVGICLIFSYARHTSKTTFPTEPNRDSRSF